MQVGEMQSTEMQSTKSIVGAALFLGALAVITGCGGNAQPGLPPTGPNFADPVITTISPARVLAPPPVGGIAQPFTLTVDGSGFVAASTVSWEGSPRPTTFINSTQLTAAIPASDTFSAGTKHITVVNPPNIISNTVDILVIPQL